MKLVKVSLITLTIVFTVLLNTSTFAKAQSNLYVSSTGNDNTGTGSMTQPWATIAHASTNAGPGSTIHVAAGTYSSSFNTNASGTSSAYITYRAETATFSGPINCAQVAANHGNLSACVHLVGVGSTTWVNSGDYVAIQGFDVTGPGMNGIYTQGTATKISGNHVHDMMNSTCNSNGGSGINLNGTYAQVTGNYVHNIGPFPSACGFIQGIYFLQAGGSAYNNISFANSGFGIQLWHYTANISLLNNTVFNNASGGIVLGTDDKFTVDYITVVNNIVANNGGVGIAEQGGSSTSIGSHNLYTNNLVYGNSSGSISLWNGRTAIATIDSSPQFVNYTGVMSGNYHLESSSPAIHAATAAAPSVDFDGTARPQNGGYDIGAYQYSSTVSGPILNMSLASLTFPATSVGKTSAVEFITVSNSGSTAINFNGSFLISGPFAFGGLGTCTSSLAPSASCTISVVFKPIAVGTAAGTLTLSDNAGTGSQTIVLSGTGS